MKLAPTDHRPLTTRYALLAWLGVAVVLGLGWYTVSAEYMKPRTVLTQTRRWTLTPPVPGPRGMTYLEGKIYIASPAGHAVAEFDTNTNSYKPVVQPISAQNVMTYAQPGDVKAGPDGLLYVQNNGEGEQALLAMKPDGQVVHQLSLNGKPPVSAGLAIGPDGSIYTTDMGRIYKYGPNGGDPLPSWAADDPMSIGFNNVIGLAVDPDGMVYAADSGDQRVQQFDSQGHFVRAYGVRCEPQYLAISGDWVDVTCQKGLVSINRKGGYVQWYRLAGNSPAPGNPVGMTYGDKDTLYLLDLNVLIEYKVQH